MHFIFSESLTQGRTHGELAKRKRTELPFRSGEQMATAGDVATAFLEMSLGTRLAVSFPASSTTADLKRRVSHEHAVAFPDIGLITVQSIKVESRGLWFHLTDSMAVRDAFRFHEINQAWHLQADASLPPMAEGDSCVTSLSEYSD